MGLPDIRHGWVLFMRVWQELHRGAAVFFSLP